MKIFTKEKLKKLIVDELKFCIPVQPIAFIIYDYYEINFVLHKDILDDMMMFHSFYGRWLAPRRAVLTLFLNLKTNWIRSKMLKEKFWEIDNQILETCVLNGTSLYVEDKNEDGYDECKYIVKKDNLRFKDLEPYCKGYYAWEMEIESNVYYGNRLYVKTLTKKRTKTQDLDKKLHCSKCMELFYNSSLSNIKEIDHSFFISCSQCGSETKIE